MFEITQQKNVALQAYDLFANSCLCIDALRLMLRWFQRVGDLGRCEERRKVKRKMLDRRNRQKQLKEGRWNNNRGNKRKDDEKLVTRKRYIDNEIERKIL